MSAIRQAHARAFSQMRMTEDDFARLEGSTPPDLRPGKTSIEVLVRYARSPATWRPANIPMGRQVLIDRYHPDGTAWDKSHMKKAESAEHV